MPPCPVIPELAYPDPAAAADWLSKAFGFTLRLRIGNHRIQMQVGEGAVVLTEGQGAPQSVMVRVNDADAHHAQAAQAGATLSGAPVTYPYGEKQYNAVDLGGHRWTFSESVADVDPADWGGASP